jgi:hypothetical protein
MLGVHAPHNPAHTWRDFSVHIATIVLGLLIAIGLEQSVETVHNRHARHQLLEDVHEELESNQMKDRMTQESLASLRVYLASLNHVLMEKRSGKAVSIDPALDTRRAMSPLYGSSMSAWESAKESGRAALLPSKQIRLYDRFEMQLGYRRDAITAFEQA